MRVEYSLPSSIVERLLDRVDDESEALFPGEPPFRGPEFGPSSLEDDLRRKGFSVLIGVDEVGRGPLAGPVVAAAVELSPFERIPGLDDSKRLPPSTRVRLFRHIRRAAAGIGVGLVTAEGVDRWNIRNAAREAMIRAVRDLGTLPEWVLVDGTRWEEFPYRQIAVVRGDQLVPSIAAASIVAKVLRDRLMVCFHNLFPAYRFDRHKGYPTREHAEAIQAIGCCGIHRRTFRVPVGGVGWTEERSAGRARRSRRAT